MKIHLLGWIVVLTLCLCGCVDTIDLNPSAERKVVVNCILKPENAQKLTLTYSALPGINHYEEIAQATITLFEDEKSVGKFHKTGYAQWELDFTPTAGRMYKLTVETDGNTPITATTRFPHPTPVRRLKKMDGDGHRSFEKDSTGVVWAFAFEKEQDTIMRPVRIDPRFKLLANIGTNYARLDNFNQRQDDLIGGTTKNHLAYLRMLPDNNPAPFYIEKLYSCVVVFRSVSDEYDQYLKSSIAKMLVFEAFDDPTQWLDESEIYSNMENGTGIFGAYSDVLFNCNMTLPDDL